MRIYAVSFHGGLFCLSLGMILYAYLRCILSLWTILHAYVRCILSLGMILYAYVRCILSLGMILYAYLRCILSLGTILYAYVRCILSLGIYAYLSCTHMFILSLSLCSMRSLQGVGIGYVYETVHDLVLFFVSSSCSCCV